MEKKLKYTDPDMRSPGLKFPPRLYKRYSDLLDHGSRNRVVTLVLDRFLDLVESHGEVAIGALAKGAIRFEIDWEAVKKGDVQNLNTGDEDARTSGESDV